MKTKRACLVSFCSTSNVSACVCMWIHHKSNVVNFAGDQPHVPISGKMSTIRIHYMWTYSTCKVVLKCDVRAISKETTCGHTWLYLSEMFTSLVFYVLGKRTAVILNIISMVALLIHGGLWIRVAFSFESTCPLAPHISSHKASMTTESSPGPDTCSGLLIFTD